MSYFGGVYLESWFSWLERGVQKTLKEEEKRRKRKTKNTRKVKWKQSEAATGGVRSQQLYLKIDSGTSVFLWIL